MYLSLVVLGLHCCVWGFFSHVRRLLVAVPPLIVEHGLWSAGSVVVMHRLICPVAGGIFLDQESNPCPLHCKQDS